MNNLSIRSAYLADDNFCYMRFFVVFLDFCDILMKSFFNSEGIILKT